jgi:ABC-type antimicrobial peptide transport system permease subunit
VRTQGRPTDLAERIRQELRQVDATLPIIGITTMEEELGRALVQERLLAALAGFFGVVAALLACGGLYGMMSYTVACRTKELGVRLALGARRADILRLILRDVLLLVGIGLVCGLAAALASTRLIATLLFGVSPTDPLTIAVAILMLIAVSLLAGFIPALRAAKTDALHAIRYE